MSKIAIRGTFTAESTLSRCLIPCAKNHVRVGEIMLTV